MSLITGYILSNGSIELRFINILYRYLRSWFALDILIVGTDWIELLWSGNSTFGFLRLGKTGRAFRLLRMLRLLRLMKLRQFVFFILERIKSERLLIGALMAQFMAGVIGWSHFMACIWYGIGSQSSESRDWVTEFGSDNVAYQYTSSLHWALSQLTGGMDDITMI